MRISSLLAFLALLWQFLSSYSLLINGNTYRELYYWTNESQIAQETASWTAIGNLTQEIYSNYYNNSYALGGLGVCNTICSYTRIYKDLPVHNIIYFDFYFIVYRYWDLAEFAILEFDSFQVIFLHNFEKKSSSNATTIVNGKVIHSGPTLNITFIVNSNSNIYGSLGIRSLNLNFANKTGFESEPACVRRSGEARKTSSCGQCPEAYYLHINGSCIPCHPDCKSCNGPSSFDCGQYKADLIAKGIRCSVYNLTCSGSTCDGTKHIGYSEKVWLGTCDPPITTIRLSSPLYSCNNTCNTDECINPSGNCSTTCKYPLIPVARYNLSFCEYPCSGTLILHENGTCLHSCEAPLKVKNYSSIPVCINNCNISNTISYYYNGSCVENCTFPFVNKENEFGKFCEFICSGNITNKLHQNGSCVSSCEYPSSQMNITNGLQCFNPCNQSGNVLYLHNGNCIQTCAFPLVHKENDFGKYCGFPCLLGNKNILHPNWTCLSSCEFPSSIIYQPYGKICQNPCNMSGTISYHYHGNCFPSCTFPLINKENDFGKYCEFVCGNDILHLNRSCHDFCYSPLILRENVTGKFCEYPCDTSHQILFYNNTCMPNSLCVTPFTRKSYDKYEICVSSCGSSYIHWNLTCRVSCDYPFKQNVRWDLNFCDGPVCDNKTCPRCKENWECSGEYYCNLFLGGFCMKKVVFLNVQLSKTVVNGYILYAEANPKVEIQGDNDDILQVYSNNIIVGSDYELVVEKLGKGLFKISLLLLGPLPVDTLLMHFKYSPFRLDLVQDILLPKIVYIPQETLKKSGQVGSASDLSFILLIVSLVVFMVLGKISNMLSFVMINQYLHSLLYLNLNYLEHTMLYFRSLKNYNALLPKASITSDPILDKQLKASLPQRFFEEKYSTSFFSNSIQIIGIVCLSVSVLMLVSSLLEKSKAPPKFLQKIKFSLRWNGIIRQVITYSLPLTIASFIQIHFSVFGKDRNIFSLVASLVCLLVFFISILKMFFIINHIPENFSERVLYADRYGALWKGLCLEGSAKYYYWISVLRGILLAYVSIFFEIFPVIQVVALIFFQCGVLSLFFRGFRFQGVMIDRDQNFVSFVLEFLLLLGKVVILVNWVLMKINIKEDTFILMGWVVIAIGLLIQTTQATYSLYTQIKNWKKIWMTIKSIFNKSVKKKVKRVKQKIRVFAPDLDD